MYSITDWIERIEMKHYKGVVYGAEGKNTDADENLQLAEA